MAKAIVDTCVFSEDWFQEILPEITLSPKVIFVYTEHESLGSEMERAKKLAKFYKLMGDKGRRLDVSKDACAKHIEFLEKKAQWRNEGACDDPHIFSMVHESGARFIFTSDKRIAACRNCMIRIVKRDYCAFSLVCSKDNYISAKSKIFS